MPGRTGQTGKGNPVLSTEYTEAEKDTQKRIDALKGELNGHFHTGKPAEEDENPLLVGICHGGPMNGHEGQSRFPKGFVLMDERDSRAWVYDYEDGAFVAREVQPLNRVGAERAAIEDTYDVRAYDRENMGSH